MQQEREYLNGYKIHKFSGCGLVLREEMIFTEEQEEDFKYHIARWVKGKGYEVLYYTGSLLEACTIYSTTLSLNNLTKENR